MNGWVDETAELRFLSCLSLLDRRAVLGENTRPEVEGVDVLPVVYGLVRLLGVVGDGATEKVGETLERNEADSVSDGLVDAPKLCGRVLHQVDTLNSVHSSVLGTLNEALVDSLEDCLTESSVTNDC